VTPVRWNDLHERYERFRLFVVSDAGRPCVRTLWPVVVLIIAIAAFTKATTGKDRAE
jgi:hypothetical protein